MLHAEVIGPRGVRLGRAPGNDLVLADPSISSHHAVVEWDGDELVLTDLTSRNGTRVGGRPVTGRERLADGAVVELGGRVTLRVHRPAATAAAGSAWQVEVGDGEARVPVRTDRFRIGSDPSSDLLVPGAPPHAAVLLIVGDEVRLATDDDDVPLVPDEQVEVAGTRITLRRVDPALAATVPLTRTTYAYRVEAALAGGTGPYAVLTDPASGRAHRVDAETRAILLWLLARRWADEAGRPGADRGWCTDEEVMAGLWGRDGAASDPTRVRVLVCRLRREIADAGLDGNCLEKRQGHLRLRVAEARVD